VARALDRLGVPRAARIDELAALLERLTARLDALAAAGIALPADAANPASGNGIAPGTRAGASRAPLPPLQPIPPLPPSPKARRALSPRLAVPAVDRCRRSRRDGHANESSTLPSGCSTSWANRT
jgi:hypothetical protein